MNLKGKVILVTGASRGIGRALARGFVADGADVVAFARSAHDLQETAQGENAHFVSVVGDVVSEADVDRLVATAQQHFGHIDVLVNNAGIANKVRCAYPVHSAGFSCNYTGPGERPWAL